MPGRHGVRDDRIGSRVQYVLVRVPEIDLRFIKLRSLLLFLLDSGEPLLLLISPSRSLTGRFATGHECGDRHARNKLKLFHI
jgi:hypothetical protein